MKIFSKSKLVVIFGLSLILLSSNDSCNSNSTDENYHYPNSEYQSNICELDYHPSVNNEITWINELKLDLQEANMFLKSVSPVYSHVTETVYYRIHVFDNEITECDQGQLTPCNEVTSFYFYFKCQPEQGNLIDGHLNLFSSYKPFYVSAFAFNLDNQVMENINSEFNNSLNIYNLDLEYSSHISGDLF